MLRITRARARAGWGKGIASMRPQRNAADNLAIRNLAKVVDRALQ